MAIRTFRVGSSVKTVPFKEQSIREVLQESGINELKSNEEVRINNENVTSKLDEVAPDDATVMVVQKVKGNG